MSNEDDYQHSMGLGYFLGSVPLVILGGMLGANSDEALVFGIAGLVCLLCAAYLLIVGAVARGIQVARRP